MMSLLVATAAFLCGVVLDFVWTKCVDSVQARKPLLAANLSVLIYVCGLVSTVLIVERAVLACTAYAIGGWVGTYLAVNDKRP